MSLDLGRVQTKLNAILAKNPEDILKKRIFLPGLGYPSDLASVQEWLKYRSDILEKVKTLTATKIDTTVKSLRVNLCANCQKIADSSDSLEMPCEKDYPSVVAIWLYKFALGLT